MSTTDFLKRVMVMNEGTSMEEVVKLYDDWADTYNDVSAPPCNWLPQLHPPPGLGNCNVSNSRVLTASVHLRVKATLFGTPHGPLRDDPLKCLSMTTLCRF